MKKAILIYPKPKSSVIQFPTGVYKVASYCAKEYEVSVIDERIDNTIYKNINNLIKNGEVLCLGLSVMTGPQIKYALKLSKRYHGRLPIVWGGLHPTILPEQVIANKYIDFVIIGDGEIAFLNLLQHLDGAKIEYECFLNKTNNNYTRNIVDISKTAYIDFTKYPVKETYLTKRDSFQKAFPIETSRGCPHNCAFCHNSVGKRKYIFMENVKIFEIIDYLVNKYAIDGIIFQEDNLFVNKKRILEILTYLQAKVEIGWKANCRIDYFKRFIGDSEFMIKLVLSKCKILQFGIESGVQRILNMINKKIDLNDVLSLNRKLAEYPINIRYNFIIGFPGETIHDIEETFNFINTLRDENSNVEPVLLSVYTPYPGTVLYETAVKSGFKVPRIMEEWSEITWRKAQRNGWLSHRTKKYIELKSKEYAGKSFYSPYSRGAQWGKK